MKSIPYKPLNGLIGKLLLSSIWWANNLNFDFWKEVPGFGIGCHICLALELIWIREHEGCTFWSAGMMVRDFFLLSFSSPVMSRCSSLALSASTWTWFCLSLKRDVSSRLLSKKRKKTPKGIRMSIYFCDPLTTGGKLKAADICAFSSTFPTSLRSG